MKRDFRLELPEADPQTLLDDEQARERYESAIRDAVRNESGWKVLSDAVLGQFSFQKFAMYDDYGRHATEIAEHEHCRRIAGDDSTPPPFAVAIPSSARFDAEVHPSKLHTILPCDASQLEAILAIKSGASLVLDGPPGTGKSQTIANVIAECLADGKTVLFVSEKAAALEVVKQRLDQLLTLRRALEIVKQSRVKSSMTPFPRLP